MKPKYTLQVGKVGGLFFLSLVLAREQEIRCEIGFDRGFTPAELYGGKQLGKKHNGVQRTIPLFEQPGRAFLVICWFKGEWRLRYTFCTLLWDEGEGRCGIRPSKLSLIIAYQYDPLATPKKREEIVPRIDIMERWW